MIISSTPATGTNVARRISILLSMAVLASALSACGGGGGGAVETGAFPTGASVNTQAIGSPMLTADPAVQVNPSAAGRQSLLAVGATPGGYAVAWLSQDDAGGNAAVQLRRFDAQAQPIGSDIAVGVDTFDGPPAVGVLAGGALVVASAVSGPASVDQPWVTRTAIRVQRFGADGATAGDIDIGTVLQNRIGANAMQYVADPAVIRWDDGGFLVGWALVQDDGTSRTPQFWVQRFSASGQPVGAPSMAAQGERDSSYRLTASPAGGWLLTTSHRTMGRTFLRYHPFEGASAPALPAGAIGIAEGSLLLPLHGGGSVLLSPAKVYGSRQRYGSDGRAVGLAGALPTVPEAAVALRDGGFIVLSTAAGQRTAQRFDGEANPVGGPVVVAADANLQGIALDDGRVALAWTATRDTGDTDVMAQQLR
jgi:hypothetical protein